MQAGRDELICDLAETYHVFDYHALPGRTVAVLACGLREDSRIIKKMTGNPLSLTETLGAAILDVLNNWIWAQSEDGKKKRNKPKSVLEQLTRKPKEPEYQAFGSSEDFEAAWAAAGGGAHGG